MDDKPTSQRQPEAGRLRTTYKETPDGVPAVWNVGDRILGYYDVMSKLGEGGMGAVYKIHDRTLNFDLAVKSPRPEIFTRANGKQDFIREAETWMKLRAHPHLVRCFYVKTLGGIPRIFAEYVDGGSLADWIRGRKLYEGGEAVALARILDVAIQFAWGLHAAHEQGLVHQDIKPANVMLTSQGVVKVTDFGLAKARTLTDEAALERPEGEQGPLVSWGGMTPAYCSPEQAARKPLSRQSDIWSWGLSVLQMFVGKVTWLAGVVAREALAAHVRVDPAIPLMPSDVVKLLARCFEPQPEKRPATLLEVASELQVIYVQRLDRTYPRENPQLAGLEASTLSDQGLVLYELGKFQEALGVYEQAIRLDLEYPVAHHNRGLALKQLGRREKALAAFEQAIRLYEADVFYGIGLVLHIVSPLAGAYNEKGLVLKDLGRLEEALAAFEQAIRCDSTFAFAYNNKGNVLLQQEQPQQALVAFEQAIRCDPTYAIAHYSKGAALLVLGRQSSALDSFQQAVDLNPDLAAPIEAMVFSSKQVDRSKLMLADDSHNKGVALLQQGKLQEALVVLEQAISLVPTFAEAYIDMGVALKRLGRLEEALDAYEQAIHLDPKLALAYSNKGNVFLQQERPQEALDAYEQAILLDPKLALAHNNKGNVLLQLGRPQEALDALEQAIGLDPKLAQAHSNKRRALLQLKKHEEVSASSKQAVDPYLLPARTYQTLGFGLLQRGEPEKALALLEQAIGLDPKLASAHYYKGLALLQLRRLGEALASLEQAIGLDPKLADAHHCKGAALSELGRPEEALAAYEQVIGLDPAFANAHFEKARVLLELGRPEEALAAYEQAVTLDPTFAKYWRMMIK